MSALFIPRSTTTQSIRRFGNSAVNIRSNEAISIDRLRAVAPSIFAEHAHESRSERYTYIPTAALLERMADAGFKPFAVMQGGSRVEGKLAFTKHLIRFRHESQQLVTVGDSLNEIVMINSHDGTSSYQLMAGVFRLVCANGLVVADNLIENVRVKHSGDVVGNVIDGCIQVLESLPAVTDSVRQMQALTLTAGEQQAFATAAIAARYEDAQEAPVRADRLLTARRSADVGNDLWRTMNRVQESMVRGGVGYLHTNTKGETSRRRTREVNGIDQSTSINRALWTLAEEMRKLKA